MEYYTAVEMRGPLPNAAAWMNLRIIILSEKASHNIMTLATTGKLYDIWFREIHINDKMTFF